MNLSTERLLLRQWKATDFDAFVKLNANAEVMRFFPSTLTPLQSIELARHLAAELELNAWGMWAVEQKSTGEFIGMVGLQQRTAEDGILDSSFIEIAWRIDQRFWGKELAPEAARAVLKYAFLTLNLESVYSLTALRNEPSIRVMQKLDMLNLNSDFQHPKLSQQHDLSWHCLFKLSRQTWLASNGSRDCREK